MQKYYTSDFAHKIICSFSQCTLGEYIYEMKYWEKAKYSKASNIEKLVLMFSGGKAGNYFRKNGNKARKIDLIWALYRKLSIIILFFWDGKWLLIHNHWMHFKHQIDQSVTKN